MDDNTCTEAGSDRLSVISGTTHGTDEFDSPRWQTGLLKMFQGSDAKDVFEASPVIGFAGKKSLNQNEYLFEGDTSQETTAPVDDNDDVMSSMSESLLSHQNIPFTNSNAPVSSQTWRKGMGTRGDNSQSRQVKGHNSDWMDHSQGTQFSPSILGPQHVSQMQQSFKTSLPNEGSVLSGFNEEEVDLLHKCQNRLKDIKILLNTSSNNHQDVMVKIGETQGLIIQGLETLHSSNGAISSDWKTCFETLKGHLGQIRQAHDVKREQLALQVKQRGQTKDKRQKIHKELLSLSMQQKSLLNLFQKQQDINKLMKSCIQTAQSSDLSQQKTLSSRSSPVSDPRSSPRSHSNSRSVPRSRSSLTKSPLTLSGSSKSSPSVTKSAQNEKLPNEDLKKKREEESQAEWNTISASTTDMTASKLGDKEKTFSRGFDSETQPLASETRNWVHVRCSSGLKTTSGTPADLDITAVKRMENVKNTMVVTGVGLKRKTAGFGAEGQQDTKPPQHAVICAHALHTSEKKKCLNPEGIQVSGNLLSGKGSAAGDVIVVQPSQKQPVHVGNKEMKSAFFNIGRGVTGCESAVMKSATSGNVGQSVAWCETAVMMSAKSQSQEKMLCTNRKESSMGSNSVLVSPGSRTLTGSTVSKQPEELGYQQLESIFAQTKSSITNLPQAGPVFKSSTDTASLTTPKVLPSSDIRFHCTDSVLQTAAVGSKQTLSYPNVTPYKVLPKLPGRKNNCAPHSYASKVLPEKQSHAQVSGDDQVNSAAEMSRNDGRSGMRQVQSAGCKPHGTETSQTPCVLTFPARMKSSEYLSTRLDSVMELMEKGLLRSGQGNLTLTIKVMFKGVPLSKLWTASVPSGVSGEEGTETCKDTPGDCGITSAVSQLCGVSSGNSAVGNKSQEPVRWAKVLVNCKVCLVSDHELAMSESFLGSDFWTENFERCHLSEELWDSITKW